jgi:ankyrin repeat protein
MISIKNMLMVIMFCCLWSVTQAQLTKILEFGDTTYIYNDPDFELLQAASEGDTNKLNAFLDLGTDVDTRSWDGVTPLMFAAQNGHLRAVEILIDAGADIDLKPYNQIDALLGATIAGHVLVADTLILNGANVNTRSLDGVTPLMYGAAFDHLLLCDVLMFYGAGVNAADNFGNSPLHFSAFYGNVDIARMLVERGAKIDATDGEGFTPLMCAAQNGHLQVVDYLLYAGSDINKTNRYNCDPLALALINRFYGVADFLMQNGANVHHKLNEKVNQYELARETGGKEVTALLTSYGAEPLHRFSIGKMAINADLNWNNADLMIGGSIELIEAINGWMAEGGYRTRPTVRSVRYDIDNNTQYQFWEKRSLIYMGVGRRIVLTRLGPKERFGAFASANAGYTYGSFRGSNRKPDDKFTFIPKAGLFYQYKALNLKLGYEYFKIADSNVSPHRVTISLGAIFNLIKFGYKLKHEPRL